MRTYFRPADFKGYFLILLPTFFVFHGVVQNFGLIYISDAFELLCTYFISAILLTVVCFALFRSWSKAFLYSFALLTFYFLFGSLHDTAKKLMPDSFLVKYSFILPFSLCLFIFLFVKLKKSTSAFKRTSKFLNLVLCLLLLTDIIFLVGQTAKQKTSATASFSYPVKNCDTCILPDVYLIVADEYAGQRVLTEQFQFDNRGFYTALKQRGFRIIDSTRSNYNSTAFSMASMLGMRYLSGIEGRFNNRNDLVNSYRLINETPLWAFLKHLGYSVTNHSIFNIDNQPGMEDQSFLVMGKRLISNQTFFSRIDRDLRYHTIVQFKIRSEIERLYKRTLRTNNETLAAVYHQLTEKPNSPVFAYIHLTMPHYPYYFRSDGSEAPLESLVEDNKTNKSDYIEYLQYTNRELLKLIDAICQRSARPPVILLMGDHGFRHFPDSVDKSYQFLNLNSVLIPGGHYENFYPGMSNINQFPVLLNTIFRQQIPLLKDSSSLILD